MYAITKINLENFQRHCFEELKKIEREAKEEKRAEIRYNLMNFIIHETQKGIIISAKDGRYIDNIIYKMWNLIKIK